MPKYDFKCKKDGEFEATVPFGEDKATCPICHRTHCPKVARLYPPAMVYKGEGFTKAVPNGKSKSL